MGDRKEAIFVEQSSNPCCLPTTHLTKVSSPGPLVLRVSVTQVYPVDPRDLEFPRAGLGPRITVVVITTTKCHASCGRTVSK